MKCERQEQQRIPCGNDNKKDNLDNEKDRLGERQSGQLTTGAAADLYVRALKGRATYGYCVLYDSDHSPGVKPRIMKQICVAKRKIRVGVSDKRTAR